MRFFLMRESGGQKVVTEGGKECNEILDKKRFYKKRKNSISIGIKKEPTLWVALYIINNY